MGVSVSKTVSVSAVSGTKQGLGAHSDVCLELSWARSCCCRCTWSASGLALEILPGMWIFAGSWRGCLLGMGVAIFSVMKSI